MALTCLVRFPPPSPVPTPPSLSTFWPPNLTQKIYTRKPPPPLPPPTPKYKIKKKRDARRKCYVRSGTDSCCEWGKYLVTVDDQVKAYIKRIMAQLNKWMTGGKISKLVIVITSKETGENVERWQFDVCFFLSPLLAFPPLSFYFTFCNRPFWREISIPHYSTG